MIDHFTNRRLAFALPRLAALAGLGFIVSLCLTAVSFGETVNPPEAELSPRDLHVWGRFDPGTWKRVRIVTDSLNDRGDVADTTTTDTKTTLIHADAKRLSLRIEATVDVAGKHFQCAPQTVEYGYYGESPDEHAELQTLGSEPLTVDGRQVFCRIQQIVASTGREKQVTQMFLSDAVEPYVLRRETAVLKRDADDDNVVNTVEEPQTTTEVIALDVPYRVLHDVKSTAYERTIQRSPRGTNVTLDITSVDVPGGIVARTSKELDLHGRTLRRSSMELVDYQIVDDDDDVPTAGKFAESKIGTAKTADDSQYYSRRQARKSRKR